MGVAGVLVASALHDGSLGPRHAHRDGSAVVTVDDPIVGCDHRCQLRIEHRLAGLDPPRPPPKHVQVPDWKLQNPAQLDRQRRLARPGRANDGDAPGIGKLHKHAQR